MAKIALGTVQFGLDYGINNKGGQVSEAAVIKILQLANSAGITVLDTASAYGNSETVLGNCLTQAELSFDLVSKLPPGTLPKDVKAAFQASLKKAKQDKLHGYLVHHFSNLKDNPGIWNEFQELKNKGKVNRIGVSLYHPHEAEYLWDQGMEFEIVQVPYSLFDRRFDAIFPKMKAKGVEVHVRSIFLQGLFFRKPGELPAHFTSVYSKIEALHDISKKHALSIADLCLGFGLNNEHIDQVVIGVDGVDMLAENIQVENRLKLIGQLNDELTELNVSDEKIILPIHWVLD